MTKRVLTHNQYENLRIYEDGRPRWLLGGPPGASLTQRGLVARVPNSGHDRANSMFWITEKGRESLATYRKRYGVRA